MHYTYAEYLSLEQESSIRHEFLDGEIYAMAGGTPDHAALAANILATIRIQLRDGCRAFTSDLRVRIPATGLSTYPDATVVCGSTRRADDDNIAVTNPIVLVEVTSPSTEEYDRGEKLRNYQAISTAREILIVSHRGPRLTLYRRNDAEEWTSLDAVAGESVVLQSIQCTVLVDDIYRDGLEDVSPTR
jgi:Uma2 family endonuclease